jgi:hypothetical protein
MKSIKRLFAGSVASLFLVLLLAPAAGAISEDQHCVAADVIELISPATTPMEQSFVPTQNRLEMVNILVDGPGFNYDQTVWIRILNQSGSVISGGAYQFTPEFSGGAGMRTAEFGSGGLVLTPGNTYTIQVDVDEGGSNSSLLWYRSNDDSCYSNGTATVEWAQPGYDFNFATLGHTYVAPTPTPTATPVATPTPQSSTTPTPTPTNATAPDQQGTSSEAEVGTVASTQQAADSNSTDSFFNLKNILLLAGGVIVLIAGVLVYLIKKKHINFGKWLKKGK